MHYHIAYAEDYILRKALSLLEKEVNLYCSKDYIPHESISVEYSNSGLYQVWQSMVKE